MRRGLLVVSLITLMLVTLARAAEMPGMGNPDRFNKTLAGMPLPDKVHAHGSLKGSIHSAEGAPLAGGEVYFFNELTGPLPEPGKYWRVPDILGTLDEKGGFSVDLPPGRYFIGAIQRKGGQALIGPPAFGDLYYAGKNIYEVLPASQNDLPVIGGAKPFTLDTDARSEGNTVIEGSVFDAAGQPLHNALVFAHIKPEMNDRPLFVSMRSDKNGAYQLRVAGGGTYYLRVRNVYGGGMPVTGSVMGVYGGDTPKAVVIKKGEIVKNVNLTGVEFAKPLKKPDNDDHRLR